MNSKRRCTESWRDFDHSSKSLRLAELRAALESPDSWGDHAKLGAISKEIKSLESIVGRLDALSEELSFLDELSSLGDSSLIQEIESRCDAVLAAIKDLKKSPDDHRDAFVLIKHGAGGTEACAWAEMLLRMYTKFANRRGFEIELIDMHHHDPEGLKDCMVKIIGPGAVGALRQENGVHRLSRVSPFDGADRRHTSFCMVEVFPDKGGESIEIKIDPKEIDVYYTCGTGPGGQAINKTEVVAVVKHLPTGILVRCQATRSQQENKVIALEILASKLLQRKREEATAARDAERGDKDRNVTFGYRDRTYVLSQGRLIHDHKTGKKTTEIEKVLDGELELIQEL